MSQWAHSHPEEMAEIAGLPPSQQNAAMRDAIGHDPDRIRDQQKERRLEEDACTCHHEGPDEFGNYDLIEDDDCPLHGPAGS